MGRRTAANAIAVEPSTSEALCHLFGLFTTFLQQEEEDEEPEETPPEEPPEESSGHQEHTNNRRVKTNRAIPGTVKKRTVIDQRDTARVQAVKMDRHTIAASRIR
mmetsp:Transcript_22433/g.33151  ORF Transcript_22433/g.33151 Transcript_22433/m.33151 type:complete len:105 (+) Transcript_22433:626-940(+)